MDRMDRSNNPMSRIRMSGAVRIGIRFCGYAAFSNPAISASHMNSAAPIIRFARRPRCGNGADVHSGDIHDVDTPMPTLGNIGSLPRSSRSTIRNDVP